MSAAETFVPMVREFLRVIESLQSFSAHQLLFKCAVVLPKIYSLGLELPDTKATDNWSDDTVSYQGSSPLRSLGSKIGKYDLYWEISDPVFEKDPVAGTLSEDLASIYQDLKGPLIAYDEGREAEAIWQWKFNIKSHCGDHLVDALRTIHRLVNDHMDPDYRNE